MIDNLTNSLYTKFSELIGGVHNPFYLAVDGRLYDTQAPENAVLPYAVYSVISDVPDWTFTTYFEDIRVQFDIFSKENSAVEIDGIYTKFLALWDWCSLTISNNIFLYMRRELVRRFRETEPQASYWHFSIDYMIKVEITVSMSPSSSPSLSPSASVSPSISPSLSLSASLSPSISPSTSPSASPSITP